VGVEETAFPFSVILFSDCPAFILGIVRVCFAEGYDAKTQWAKLKIALK
jgi:hypothetical protein